MKIHSIESKKEGFDDLPMEEIEKMVGFVEYDQEADTWDVTTADESNFECSNQENAHILAGVEEIKAMLIEVSLTGDKK